MTLNDPPSSTPIDGQSVTRGPHHAAPSDSHALQKRARRGVALLAARGVLMQLIVLGGEIYLRRRLDPGDFGTFAIAQFALAFFVQLGDVGLAGALIREHDVPSQRLLSSVWALQLLASLAVTSALWAAAPLALKFWSDMPPQGVWVIRALSINLVLTSLRVVPALLMERNLEYGKLALLDVLLGVAYQGTAVTLAFLGYGLTSLAAAVIAQGVCGVVAALVLRPWRPSLVLDTSLLRPILHFGFQLQLRNVIAFLSSAIAPVYAGRMLGQRALGFINWGQSTAYFPLKWIEIVARVSFPLYSRLQSNPRALADSLERSVASSALGTLFFAGLGFGLGPNIVQVVYGGKWMPALPLFYVYLAGISIGFLHPVIAPALDALGKPAVNSKLMISWTIAIAICVAFTTPRFGALGFAVGYCVPMVMGNLVVMWVLKQLTPEAKFLRRTKALVLGATTIAAIGRFVLASWARTPLSLAVSVLVVATIFFAVVGIFDPALLRGVRGMLSTSSNK